MTIVDAATGAGETTVRIAEALEHGCLISIDNDARSWHEWALPALEGAGLTNLVEFRETDLREEAFAEPSSADLIVSDATLSALGVYAGDALAHFHRALKAGGRLAVRDLLPESESLDDPDNVASQSWRLMKAVSHLVSEEHYEEIPTDWIKTRLAALGFEILSFDVERERVPASKSSYEEWRKLDVGDRLPEGPMRDAVRERWAELVSQAATSRLTTKTGCYALWARKPAGDR
jgi:SAM-dependent methyltransferase